MDIQIIFIRCLCDEFLKASNHCDDEQCKMYTAEIMTFAICSALFFHGNFARTRSFFLGHHSFSFLYGDKAYTDYKFEDLLKEIGVDLLPQRKINSKRRFPGTICYLQKLHRKRIETVFSQITHVMPRSIQAVTPKGFALKTQVV